MYNRDAPPGLGRMIKLMVTPGNTGENPAFALQPLNHLSTMHASIIHNPLGRNDIA